MDASLIEVLKYHSKAIGITGASLTLAGGISLAIDALFKKREQIELAAAKLIKKDFPTVAQDAAGRQLDPHRIEQASIDKMVRFAKIGACLLVIGFAFLLLSRILAE
jgi:hypothetical protein